LIGLVVEDMAPASGNGQSGNTISRLWKRLRMNATLGWGCEISPSGITLARWNGSASDPGTASWRPLPPGAVEASPLRENLLRPEEVREALAGCLESLGRLASTQAAAHPADIALVIPDQAARVFFISLEAFPNQPAQAIPLIRWKLKKSVPFDIDTSTISYLAQRRAGEWQVLAVVSPEAIVRQYEALVESMGLKPRFVTLSTLGALGLLPSDEPPDASFLLAKYSPPWLTTTVLYEGAVHLFRTAPIGANDAAGASSDALQEALEAIHPSAAYFQDNFGKPLERAYLCGLGDWSASIADSLVNELHLPTRHLVEESAPAVAGWDRLQAEQHMAALMGISKVRRRP
jgi:type IV pilus assembly protein PilM